MTGVQTCALPILKLSDDEYRFFSIVSLDRAIEGISISEAKYNVANYTLDRFSSRCISNEIEDGADIVSSYFTKPLKGKKELQKWWEESNSLSE